jgi:hypothetical protein
MSKNYRSLLGFYQWTLKWRIVWKVNSAWSVRQTVFLLKPDLSVTLSGAFT